MKKEQRFAVIMLVVWAVLITASMAAYIALHEYLNILVYLSGAFAGAWVYYCIKELAE